MPTLKAGCFLIDTKTKKLAVVYRQKFKQYSFPKGHLEGEESLLECAIRETEEETKRKPKVLPEFEPIVEAYTTPAGELCECYMYFAIDDGPSDNKSTDSHDTFWFYTNEIDDLICYSDGLLNTYRQAKPIIQKILNKN